MPALSSHAVDVYPYRDGGAEWLVLRRAPGRPDAGTWRIVGGKIEPGEAAWQAALRELAEETGCTGDRVLEAWALPSANVFYEPAADRVVFAPAFAVEVAGDPVLDAEHDAWAWLPAEDAAGRLVWPEQARLLLLAASLADTNRPAAWRLPTERPRGRARFLASMPDSNPEAWLCGPVEGVPDLLQPVAHALVQARLEVDALAADLEAGDLWERPGGAASAGFHLRHLAGVVDRLFTYARGEALSPDQLATLEGEATPDLEVDPAALAAAFSRQVDAALEQLRDTDPATLTEPRGVGRQQIPSTVIGLLVHAAEHTTRHVGQLLVTVRVVSASRA